MRRIFLIFAIGTIWNCSFAQKQAVKEQPIVESFVRNFNGGFLDSIFFNYSSHFQEAMPLSKTKEFLMGVKKQFGAIEAVEFIEYSKENNAIAVYKAKFQKQTLEIDIVVDDDKKIHAYQIKPYIDRSIPVKERTITKMILPFHDSWYVVWGGDTEAQNYHVVSNAQKNAFDFVVLDESNNTHRESGEHNEDYYCFGKELLAPCNGEVVLAVDGIKDNKPGEMNNSFPLGNTVVIKTTEDEYIYLCHFKQNSVKVEQGQQVKQGEVLGLCGNSGRSSEAHLHFHIQNTENSDMATGIKCYFEEIIVNQSRKEDYSPVQEEVVSNNVQ